MIFDMADEVGSVSILGSIDVENLMQGLREMKRGLDEAKASARASFGDLEKIGEAVAGIATPIAAIGVGLASTMLGIAALSPAVAPALAKMEVGFLKLTRIIGEELQPVFEEAAVLFQGFVEWLGSEEGRGAIQLFGNAFTGVLDTLKGLGDWAGSEEGRAVIGFVTDFAEKLGEIVALGKPFQLYSPGRAEEALDIGKNIGENLKGGLLGGAESFLEAPPGEMARSTLEGVGAITDVLFAPARLLYGLLDFNNQDNVIISALRYAGISAP